MVKKPRLLIALVLGLALLGAGLTWLHQEQGSAPSGNLVLRGNVDIRQAELAFKVSERIQRMLVQEGDRVKAGQVLASLDTRNLEQLVAQQAAQVAAQRQVVARLRAGSRVEEIRKAEADVAAARIEAGNAAHNAERAAALSRRHFVSPQQADDAQAAADGARARLHSAEEALHLLRAGARKEDIAAAEATLQAQEAGLALARQALSDASLTAPSPGVIHERLLEPGDMASPQRPVYTLAFTEPIWVRAYVSGTDLGKLKPGMSASVTTDSYPGKAYHAWVGFVSPTAEFTPKTVQTDEVRTTLVYQVRAMVCNPQDELRLGMPATVTIPLDQAAGAARTGNPCTQH